MAETPANTTRTRAPGEGPAGSWGGQYDANGVDITLIRQNLGLTPLERARKAERLRLGVLRTHDLVGIRRDAKPA